MVKQFFTPILGLVVLAVSAAVTLLSTAMYMGIPLNPLLAFNLGAITYFIYCLNKYTDTEDAASNKAERDMFLDNPFILIFSFILLAASFLLMYLNSMITRFHVIIVLIGIAYSVRVIPVLSKGGIRFQRLKDICILKSLSVSVVWGTSVFAVNYLVYADHFTGSLFPVLMLMITYLLISFENTVFCDIVDREDDSASSIATIPVRYGKKKTYLFCFILPDILFGALILLSFIHGWINPLTLSFIVINLMFPFVYISVYEKDSVKKKYSKQIADFCFSIFAVLLIVLCLVERICL